MKKREKYYAKMQRMMSKAKKTFLSFSNPLVDIKPLHKTINRSCAICGAKIVSTYNVLTKKYKGGNYFFGKGDGPDEGLGGEYWECDSCFDSWDCDEKNNKKQTQGDN